MKLKSTLAAIGLLSAALVHAEPVTYVIAGSHTFPRFSYSHFGFSTQLSRFDKTTGQVVFDAQAKTGSVDVVIDTRSVNTGFADFNGHIQAEDFLDTAKFPTATFKSTKVVFEGEQPKSIDGVLTIKGEKKEEKEEKDETEPSEATWIFHRLLLQRKQTDAIEGGYMREMSMSSHFTA